MMARERRILAVVPSGYCYGLQNLTLSFFGALPAGIRAHFLNTRWSDGEFDLRLDAIGVTHSATWLGMFSRRLDWKNLSMTALCVAKLPLAWLDFIRTYRSFQPDVVYTANHHETILLWPILVWLRRKVVCHVHDPPPPIAFQKLSFFFWRRAVGRFLFISRSTMQRFDRLSASGAGGTVVYNGVAIAALSQPRVRRDTFVARFGWPEDCVVFGLTGQFTPQKGHENFLRAAAQAARGNSRLRFVIGGRAEDPYLSRLTQLIAALDLESRVGFAGWLPAARQFYEGIDVLVLSSRHDEGFGLVIAEAAERGVPAIATRSGGAVEVIREDETGVVVEKEDSAAMAAAMSHLGADASLRTRMGVAARARITSDFDLAKQAERFAAVLFEKTPAADEYTSHARRSS